MSSCVSGAAARPQARLRGEGDAEQQDGGPQQGGTGRGECEAALARGRGPAAAAAAARPVGGAAGRRLRGRGRPRGAAGAVEGGPAHPYSLGCCRKIRQGHADAALAMAHGITVFRRLHGLRHHADPGCGSIRTATWTRRNSPRTPQPCASRAAAAGVVHCVLPAVAPVQLRRGAANSRTGMVTATRWASIRCARGDATRRATWKCWTARWPRTATIRGWSPSARSGSTTSCRAWTARGRSTSTASSCELARRHGLPVLLHVRRSADALLKHLRAHAGDRHRPCVQRQRAAGRRIRAPGLQAGLRRHRHLRARAADPAAGARAAAVRAGGGNRCAGHPAALALPHRAGARRRRAAGPQRAGGAAARSVRCWPAARMAPQALAAATSRNACDALPRLAALLARG